MSANPIWIAGYFGPVAGAAPVWIAPGDGTVPSAVQSEIVSYSAPVAGATAVWIAGFFRPSSSGDWGGSDHHQRLGRFGRGRGRPQRASPRLSCPHRGRRRRRQWREHRHADRRAGQRRGVGEARCALCAGAAERNRCEAQPDWDGVFNTDANLVARTKKHVYLYELCRL